MEGYLVDFVRLILEYMTRVYNLARNFLLYYSNVLTHIFKYFYISPQVEQHLKTQIPTIKENNLKCLIFKPLPIGHWKHEDKISTDDIELVKPRPSLKSFLPYGPSGLRTSRGWLQVYRRPLLSWFRRYGSSKRFVRTYRNVLLILKMSSKIWTSRKGH